MWIEGSRRAAMALGIGLLVASSAGIAAAAEGTHGTGSNVAVARHAMITSADMPRGWHQIGVVSVNDQGGVLAGMTAGMLTRFRTCFGPATEVVHQPQVVGPGFASPTATRFMNENVVAYSSVTLAVDDFVQMQNSRFGGCVLRAFGPSLRQEFASILGGRWAIGSIRVVRLRPNQVGDATAGWRFEGSASRGAAHRAITYDMTSVLKGSLQGQFSFYFIGVKPSNGFERQSESTSAARMPS